ncbi:MAG: hypothetical protein ABIF12_03955 [bacterium]
MSQTTKNIYLLLFIVGFYLFSNNYAQSRFILEDRVLVDNPEYDGSDVLYQDKNVCILDPSSKRGILIFHESPSKKVSEGLFCGKLIYEKKRAFVGMSNVVHDIIFFRGPQFIANSGQLLEDYKFKQALPTICPYIVMIKVDPEKTYVFSSVIRTLSKYRYKSRSEKFTIDYNKSKKTISEHFKKIEENKNAVIKDEDMKIDEFFYNLHTSEKISLFTYCDLNKKEPKYPWLPQNQTGIVEWNSEVIIKLPYIPKEWFVSCYKNNKKQYGIKRDIVIEEPTGKPEKNVP